MNEILKEIHSWCVEELYTDKYKEKSGALMGSKVVKADMESPDSTFCSNAGWKASEEKLALDEQKHFKDLFNNDDPCAAGKMYHYVGAGVGSWVSNIANVMYTHSIMSPVRTVA